MPHRSRSQRRFCSAWALLAAAASLIAASQGGAAGEIERVRVPSARVPALFPAGAELRVLPFAEFDDLDRRVAARPKPGPGPRLIRARHQARWEDGVLVGRSELTVAPGAAGPGGESLVAVDPWTPAITGGPARATAEGRLALPVTPGGDPATSTLDWRLRSRGGSDGGVFTLGLPDLDVASLVLDLPRGLIPDCDRGERVGPAPAPTPDRETWTVEGARGRLNLRFRRADGEDDAVGAWVEGTVRVDLGENPARWSGDWTVAQPMGAPSTLQIDFDAGLDVLDVVGPRVARFQVEPRGGGSRVVVQLTREGPTTFPLGVRAVARVPFEGAWSVPGARFPGSTRTGEQVLVRVDGARTLAGCVERQGRRVPTRPDDFPGKLALRFESTGPGPVADLEFRRPRPHLDVDLEGTLRVGRDTPRLDVTATWTAAGPPGPGPGPDLALPLPPGWAPDRAVRADGVPIPWQVRPGGEPGSGPVLLFAADRLGGAGRRPGSVTVSAVAASWAGLGPIELPRIPAESMAAAVADQTWTAVADPGVALRPVDAEGLVWLDAPGPIPADADRSGPRPARLAWRWVGGPGAHARAEVLDDAEPPRGNIETEVTLSQGRVRVEWSIRLDVAGGPIRSIAVHADDAAGDLIWDADAPSDVSVSAQPLDPADARVAEFPATGRARRLAFSRPVRGGLTLRARLDRPWTGAFTVPTVSLGRELQPRGLVAIRVDPSARVRYESDGYEAIDPSSGRDDGPPGSDPAPRRVALLARVGPEASIRLRAEPGAVAPDGGIVREAVLESEFRGEGEARHRLDLRVAADSARSLTLALPPGATLDRVRRDGQPVVVTAAANSAIAIALPTPARPTTSITLDYRTPPPPPTWAVDPAAILPRCPFPCLSLVWKVAVPGGWSVRPIGGGLTPTVTPGPRSWADRWLGIDPTPASTSAVRPSPRREAALLADLDALAAQLAPGGITLGDYLGRLDAGRWPIVVDRFALGDLSLGPASRLTLEDGAASAAEALGNLGLRLVAVGEAVLVTRRGESEVTKDEADRVRRAAAQRSDDADRFQSALRWQGEATPRALAVGETSRPFLSVEGRRVDRFVAPGWPAPGQGRLRFADAERSRGVGWLVAAAVLAGGIAARRLPARWRGGLIAAVGAAAVLGVAWTWDEPSAVATGTLRGLLGLVGWWAGSRPIRARRTTGPDDDATWLTAGRRSLTPTRVSGAAGALILATLAGAAAQDAAPAVRPILAVFPYDGPPDPSRPPDRVVMLLADFERLQRLARPGEPPAAVASLVAARHAVGRPKSGRVAVETALDLWVAGAGEALWPIPVGPARDLAAEVDGAAVVLGFTPDGAEALVPVGRAGAHSVRLRRWVPCGAAGGMPLQVRIPVNPAAFARVTIAGVDGAGGIDLPDAAGMPGAAGGGIEASLGPVPILEVRWTGAGPAADPAPVRFDVDALWDVRPAGNRLRLRLAHDRPAGLATLRLALAPGVAIREGSIPNLVATHREGGTDRPVWVAHVDPPWPAGTPIEVEAWSAPGRNGLRRPPRVVVAGPSQVAGTMTLRVPAGWSAGEPAEGAGNALAGLEPWTEAAAARLWEAGSDPDLRPAGWGRFAGRMPSPALAVRQIPARTLARTAATASARAGRLDVALESALNVARGERHELSARLPEAFQILGVEADGMTGWFQPEPGRVTVRFDGSDARNVLVRIRGFVPAPPATMSAAGEPAAFRAAVPWPAWDDAAEEPGSIAVAGPARFDLPEGGGIIANPAAGEPRPAGGPASFRVERPDRPLVVAWNAPGPYVDLAIVSDVTILPAALIWTATLRCDIGGGPARSLTWTLPTAWARNARVEVRGQGHRLQASAEGELTRWTVIPDRPFWGTAELVVHSTRPSERGREWRFPDLAPLATPGRGRVRRHELGMVNASGEKIEVAGSPGLREGAGTRHRVDGSPLPPGPADRSFEVSSSPWSLRVAVGDGPAPAGPRRDRGDEPARVAQADLVGAIDDRGAIAGRATYELERGVATFLPIRIAGGGQVPWASVDGRVVAPVYLGDDRWSVPLGPGEARRVRLTWAASSRSGDVILPAPEQDGVPTLVALASPGTAGLAAGPGRFWPIDGPSWDVEAAERLAARIGETLTDFDRDSAADREVMLSELARFEKHARGLRRAEATTTPAAQAVRDARRGRIDAARAAIDAAISDNGLDDLLPFAGARAGSIDDPVLPAATPPSEFADAVRVRQVGSMAYFRGVGPSSAPRGGIRRSTRAPSWPAGADLGAVFTLGAGLITVAGLAWAASRLREEAPGRRRALAVAAGLGVALLVAAPGLGLAYLAVAVAGRLDR